ncbi:ATP-grasp domain-containing protein [Thermoleptolyngbya sp. PKUAC-SCTB121]|uniref:ATP-grasp domain-containing protein n=1 Tax=Thermoleptolyngbya sp. PKUAC-SCTB121 TaxID=2811482 RepID=UPI0019627D56|nr:ATP-grasp domain-containing protein [Thermoleptolyngbya sp. PKUAC-SCTB121]
MIVLFEGPGLGVPAELRRSLEASGAIAEILGFPVWAIATDGSGAAEALAAIPAQPQPTAAFWLAPPTTAFRYGELFAAAHAKNLHLPNTSAQHQLAQEFHRAYPLLKDLTPASIVLEQPDAVEGAIAQLGLPLVFQRSGSVAVLQDWQRALALALRSSIAKTPAQARRIAADLFNQELNQEPSQELSQEPCQPVLARQWVNLRHHHTTPAGFPLGREFRVVLYDRAVLTYGYAWPGDDPGRWLSVEEEEAMFAVAFAVAERLDVPLLGVDIAQTQSGEWIALKTVDPQFVGSPQLPLVHFWQQLGITNEMIEKRSRQVVNSADASADLNLP